MLLVRLPPTCRHTNTGTHIYRRARTHTHTNDRSHSAGMFVESLFHVLHACNMCGEREGGREEGREKKREGGRKNEWAGK